MSPVDEDIRLLGTLALLARCTELKKRHKRIMAETAADKAKNRVEEYSRKILSNTEQCDEVGRDAVCSLLSGGIVDQKIINDRRIDLLLEKDGSGFT